MTIDQARHQHHPSGADRVNQAAAPGTNQAAGPGSEGVKGDVPRPTHRLRRWAAGTLGVLAMVAAVALAVWPYQRGLVGYLDGDREVVRTDCGAPIVAAFTDRTGNLLVDETTWADGPPCQRSAAFRLALAGIVAALGLIALADAWRHRSMHLQPAGAERRGRPLIPQRG